MRRNRTRILVAAIAMLAAAGGFAEGAGGVTHGFQYLDLGDRWFRADVRENCVGGFGYGVSRRGERIGGFGLAFTSDDPSVEFAGGVGGLINGQQVSIGALTAAAVAWTGIGCVSADVPGLAGSWIVAFAEVDLEVGWAVTPWFQVSGYAGMQVMGDVSGGRPLDEFLFWTPVVGARLSWGSF